MATRKAAGKKKGASATKVSPARDTPARQAPATIPGPVKSADSSLGDVPLTMTVELGRTRQAIGTVERFGEQSLVELDRTVGAPVDVLLNGELWARAEVVTVSENFGVRIVELVSKPGS